MASYSTFVTSSKGKEGKKQIAAMRNMMGPGSVDQAIRMAISQCWMIMPEKKKNVPAVSKEIRRIVERALKGLEEDAKSFSLG